MQVTNRPEYWDAIASKKVTVIILLFFEKVGITTSSIRYNFSTEEWTLSVGSRPTNPSGVSSSTFKSFLLGRSTWTIFGDSKKSLDAYYLSWLYEGCNKGLPYNQTVKISGCMEDEFTCDDGQCIDISDRCDQIINCEDKSDEVRCQLIVLDYGYKRKVPPFTLVR